MNKKSLLVLALASTLTFTSCGGNGGGDKSSSTTQSSSENSSSIATVVSSENSISEEVTNEIKGYKAAAISKLDEIVNPVIAKISDQELREAVQKFYDDEKKYINDITDLETAKAAATKVVEDAKDFAKNTLRPLGIKKLNDYFNPLIAKLPDEDLKTSVQNFYNTEMTKIAQVETLDDIAVLYKEILNDVEEFIKTETERILIILKDQAVQELDQYVVDLINKIPYEKLKTDTQNFYSTEKVKIQNADTIEALKELVDTLKKDLLDYAVTEMISIAITELDQYVVDLMDKIPNDTLKTDTQALYETEKAKLQSCKTCEEVTATVKEIKDDLVEYALTESKKLAKQELDKVVNAGLKKLPNESVKKELRDFYDAEMLKIMAVDTLENVQPTLTTVLEETEAFIKQLIIRTAKEYLSELFTYNLANPYQYVPEAMRPDYASNFVSSPVTDFTSSVAVSSMNKQGYGEQWQMVVTNLNQMLLATSAINVVDASMTTIANAMNIYIENTTTEELDHTIDNEDYKAELTFKDGVFYLGVSFKKSFNVIGFGAISPNIKLSLDILESKKAVYIGLNENNSIKYTMHEDEFELASTYGINAYGKSGSVTSYFDTKVDENGNKYGHIYEYTTYEGSDKIQACADFYVNNGYISVVGNKASGMVGFNGFINELYSANEGRLLGYKVQEELTISGVTGTYHTLWFNLWDINGIDNVRVTEKTSDNKSSKSTVDVYLNNKSSLFVPTYNSKLGIKTSRKYDIELRNRYLYNTVDGKTTSTAIETPMMFIQDDNNVDTNYSDFSANFKAANGFDASVKLPSSTLTKIRNDYDTMIPVFKQNKDNMSSEVIIQYLNQFYNNN